MNVFDIPASLPKDELVQNLWAGKNTRIERIVSAGQTTGWYDQNETEWLVLLQGAATLEFEDGSTTALHPGDTLLLKPHKKHRVAHTSAQPPCIWLCVFAGVGI